MSFWQDMMMRLRFSRLGLLFSERPNFWRSLPFVAVVIAAVAVAVSMTDTTGRAARYQAMAERAIERGDLATAMICYRRLLTDNRDDPRHRFGMAKAMAMAGQRRRAEAMMRALTPADAAGYPPAHLFLARSLIETGPDDDEAMAEARSHLQRYLQSKPSDAAAHLLMGRTAQRLGDTEGAERHFAEAAETYIEARVRLARLLMQRQRYETGQRHARVVVDQLALSVTATSTDRAARVHYADALVLVGRLGDAADVLRDGVAIDPAGPFASTLAKLQYERAANFAQHQSTAKRRLEEAVRTLSDRDDLTDDDHGVLGASLQMLRRLDEAIPHLRTASRSMPHLLIELAEVYHDLGREPDAERTAAEALEHYRRRSAEEPNDERWTIFTAYALMALGRFDEAVGILEPLWKSAPSDRVGKAMATAYRRWWESARAEAPDQTPEEALRLLRLALRHHPSDTATIRHLIEARRKDPGAAPHVDALFTEMLANGEAPAAVHFMIGTDALLRQDHERAHRHLQIAYRLRPRSPGIANNFASAILAYKPEDADRALKIMNVAVQTASHVADYHDTRGHALARLKQWPDAIAAYETALSLGADTATLRRSLARAYHAIGDDHLARQHEQRARALEKATAADPTPPGR